MVLNKATDEWSTPLQSKIHEKYNIINSHELISCQRVTHVDFFLDDRNSINNHLDAPALMEVKESSNEWCGDLERSCNIWPFATKEKNEPSPTNMRQDDLSKTSYPEWWRVLWCPCALEEEEYRELLTSCQGYIPWTVTRATALLWKIETLIKWVLHLPKEQAALCIHDHCLYSWSLTHRKKRQINVAIRISFPCRQKWEPY